MFKCLSRKSIDPSYKKNKVQKQFIIKNERMPSKGQQLLVKQKAILHKEIIKPYFLNIEPENALKIINDLDLQGSEPEIANPYSLEYKNRKNDINEINESDILFEINDQQNKMNQSDLRSSKLHRPTRIFQQKNSKLETIKQLFEIQDLSINKTFSQKQISDDSEEKEKEILSDFSSRMQDEKQSNNENEDDLKQMIFKKHTKQKEIDEYSEIFQEDNQKLQKISQYKGCQQYQQESSQLYLIDFSLRDNINKFVGDITQRTPLQTNQNLNTQQMQTISLSNNKIYQSSLSGMHKLHNQEEDFIEQQDLQMLQIQFRNGNIVQVFTQCVINRQYSLAMKTFSKMSQSQKNMKNNKGFSPLILVFFCTLLMQQAEDKKCIKLLKYILSSPEITSVADPILQTHYKFLYYSIMYRSISVTTTIFRASYTYKHALLQNQIQKFIEYLQEIDDFTLELSITVGSFIPLIQTIAPDDKIVIRKSGKMIRIDYTLVGYTYLKCKRRNMSLIIGKFSKYEKATILAVNHNDKKYTNLFQSISTEELALIIEDMLSVQLKIGTPKIISAKKEIAQSLFGHQIQQNIAGFQSQKNWLKVCYSSNTQKMQPGCRNLKQLSCFESLENYKNFQFFSDKQFAKKNTTKKIKQLKLGLWIPQEFPIKFQSFIKVMGYLSLAAETGKILYDFLSSQKILKILHCLPTKIQIPINFSMYLDIEVTKIKEQCIQTEFDYTQKYQYVKRCVYQKTLERREKRAVLRQIYS